MLEHEELGTAELVRVRLDELFIDESWNARREGLDKEELAELVADIESQGLLQPIIVRQLEDGRYALVAGFLRAAACRQIDEAMVLDCKLLQTSDDEDEAELEAYHANLSENLKRKPLKPWEIADVLHRIREKRPDLPGRELSRSVGLRYGYCSQLLEMRSRAHPDLWAIFQKFG
ncbi:MAG: ParB/RepB/Spo0J family partition protein, partial [Myxococcales bacterium]|nr:ParB/RepB/Spo0J family partition protein [Myxococcales bacterium]